MRADHGLRRPHSPSHDRPHHLDDELALLSEATSPLALCGQPTRTGKPCRQHVPCRYHTIPEPAVVSSTGDLPEQAATG